MKVASVLLALIFSIAGLCSADTPAEPKLLPAYNQAGFDAAINNYYRTNKSSHNTNIETRLQAASSWLLGKPYELGALGEGEQGQFDQHPLYRTDAFDCLTYVSTVLALAHADNLTQFKRALLNLNYFDGKADYVHRLHFTSIDWNPNVLHLGYTRDITPQILDNDGVPAAELADTIINKPKWYQSKKLDALAYRRVLSDQEKQALLNDLHNLSKDVQQERSVMLYVPLYKLFIDNRKPNADIFAQIPNASIIEIVRPSWDLEAKIGTRLHVSHIGFAFRTANGLMFREASSVDGKVIDIPLEEYLKSYLNSPTIKGIHIQKIVN